MLGNISASKINPHYSIVDGKTFKDWRSVAYTISAIKDQTGCLSSCIKTQNCLLLELDLWSSKLFEKDVGCLDSIGVGVKRWLSQENRVLLG
jgi:hypothetical protein